MKQALIYSAVAALVALSAPAQADTFLDFKVDEGSVPGASANVLTADKLNGGYAEYLAVTGPTTFSAQGYANFGQYFANEGTTLVASQLNGFGASGYGMYALFTETGNITGPNTFNTTGGSFKLYIDVNNDTSFGTSDGVTPIVAGNTGDDYQIAFSNTVGQPSIGNLNGPPGAFDLRFTDFTLVSNGTSQDGDSYFIDPNPFYLYVQVNGDYDQFVPGTPSFVTGDVSAVFRATPEPASLALIGVALAGLGIARRKSR